MRREWRVVTEWSSGGVTISEPLADAGQASDMATGHREYGHVARVEFRDVGLWADALPAYEEGPTDE